MKSAKTLSLIIIAVILVFLIALNGNLVKGQAEPLLVSFSHKKLFDNWECSVDTLGSEYSLSESDYSTGSVLKLVGTTIINLNLTRLGLEVDLETFPYFNYAWNFENNLVHYIGYILSTEEGSPNIYITSYFNRGVFTNNSNYIVYQITNEETNIWYSHSINLTSIFYEYYEVIPIKITYIRVINAYFGPATSKLTASNQVTYFNDFSFSSDDIPSESISLDPLTISLTKTKSCKLETHKVSDLEIDSGKNSTIELVKMQLTLLPIILVLVVIRDKRKKSRVGLK